MNVQFLGASRESTASSYSVYRALIKQTGTSAPTQTILENSLGLTILFSYTTIGTYAFTMSEAFDEDKMVCFIGNNFKYSEGAMQLTFTYSGGTTNNGALFVSAEGTGLINGMINANGTLLEIRKYT
jgi:hypothetical protein